MSVGTGAFSDILEKTSSLNINADHVQSDIFDQLNEEIEQSENDQDDRDFKSEPVSLNFDHLKHIIYELGLIKLCWPEITQSYCEERENFPESYFSNNEKEKVLLLYAENFRLQFCNKYPNRKPLFLACENECGIQVSVSFTHN